MEIKLCGKRAVVSGSTSGMGFAIAKELAKSGAKVLINGRTEAGVALALQQLSRELPTADVSGYAADLSTAAGAQGMIAYWPETDILVNNLGRHEEKPFFEITDDDWEEFFQVNVMSAVRLSRHYAQGMVRRGFGRVIFNASTVSGFFPGEMVHWGGMKAAVLGISRGLAEHLAGTGVTVNAYLPGPTATARTVAHLEQQATIWGQSLEELQRDLFEGNALSSSLLKRFITPEEIANLVTFIASEQAQAITGAALRVDGGIVRSLL